MDHMLQKNMVDQPSAKQGFTQEFMGFLKTFGIIGLAIAFVIGAAASKLVTAFVTDIVNPIIGLALPSGDLKSLMATVTNTVTGAVSEFKYGDLIANIIDFLIIALIVFIAYKVLSKYKLVDDKTKPA
jgi:large conductance mechanosensitive channel